MRPIEGHPDYLISTTGTVWSSRSRLFLQLCADSGGYSIVTLCKNGGRKTCRVHRLVLESFIGFCPPKMECRHLDGNKTNNQLDNLCWGTHKQNIHDAVQHGTRAILGKGEKHPNSKLSDQNRRLIFSVYHDGDYTQQELADYFEVGLTQVNRIVRDNRWGATHV